MTQNDAAAEPQQTKETTGAYTLKYTLSQGKTINAVKIDAQLWLKDEIVDTDVLLYDVLPNDGTEVIPLDQFLVLLKKNWIEYYEKVQSELSNLPAYHEEHEL